MHTGQRIIKNSIVLTVSQVLSKFVNIGLILVLTRLLGKDGFGVYSFSFAYVSLFGFLIHLGLITLLVREIAKHKDQTDTLLGSTFPIVIIFSGITLLLMNTVAFALDWNTLERTIISIFGFYFVFDTFGRYFLAVARAFEKMEYVALTDILERILLLCMATICWLLQYSLIHLVILFAIVELMKAVSGFVIVTKYFTRFKLIWWPEGTWSMLKEAYPFALIGLFTIVSQRIDLIFLKYFYSTDVVGIYSAARKFIESLAFIPENIYFAVFPALSVLFISQKEKFNLTFQRTFIALLTIAVPISAGLYILAPKIIHLLFEPEFKDAAIALRWLSIALLAIFIRYVFAAVLNTIGKQRLFAIIMGISMSVNIIMNLILIPKYQIAGASIAVIGSELTIIFCSLPVILKIMPFSWIKTFVPKILIMGILMCIIIFMVKDWALLPIVLLSASVYILLLFILNLVSLKELKDYFNIFIEKYTKQ